MKIAYIFYFLAFAQLSAAIPLVGWDGSISCTYKNNLSVKNNTYRVAEADGTIKVRVVLTKEGEEKVVSKFYLNYLKLFVEKGEKLEYKFLKLALENGNNEVLDGNDYWQSTVVPLKNSNGHKFIKNISFDLSLYQNPLILSSEVVLKSGISYKMFCIVKDEMQL